MNIDLEKYNIPADESIVVGVSAGPDSMALLHYLMKNSKYNKADLVEKATESLRVW